MPNAPSAYTNWQPTIPVDQSIYEPDSTQRAPLGTKITVGERVFYYAQASASVAAGTVLCAAAPTASHQSGILAIAATNAGAKIISGTSSASVAANYYAEGYFGAALGVAAGEIYKVQKHPAGTAAIPITLYDGLNQTITSGVGFWLMPNPYKNCFVGSSALGYAIGVAPTAVSSGNYFWLQTWGIANPTHSAASAAAVALKLATGGAVHAMYPAATDGPGVVGVMIGKNSQLAATAGENNPVFLTIRP